MTETINNFAFVDTDGGSKIEYSGPFPITRDGGDFEVAIPVNPDDYAGIHEQTAENLTDRVEDIAVAIRDGSIYASGVIDAVEIIEQSLIVRVDDGNRVDPSEMEED